MHETTERVLEELERGRLTRREAVGRIVALAAASFAAPAHATLRDSPPAPAASDSVAPTFRSIGLNHVALRVTDIERSSAFYERHLGLERLSRGPSSAFLAAGTNHFVALFRADLAGLDHHCYTIEDYDPAAVVERLRAVGLTPRRADDRVYFDDPDGLEVQLASRWGDYPGRRPGRG